MLEGAKIAVVVPAFNEALLIQRTLAAVPPFVDHIIVVDDGSDDDTHAIARAHGDPRVIIERHGDNRGVGAAIVTGYTCAFAVGADIATVMAGDAQMDPRDLGALLTPLLRDEADYVKGDRLSHPSAWTAMPLTRWIGNHALSLLTRWVTGLSVRDSQCGYTALSRAGMARLSQVSLWPRYGYPNDLLGHLAEQGARVRDVVVRPVYADERSGIGLRHALLVIPFVLGRVLWRRVTTQRALPLATARR
jgi:glycosyltransferase involved in cell wall biosynthesis